MDKRFGVVKIKEKMTYRIIQGKNVILDMIDQAILIDTLVYPKEYCGNKEVCYSWWEKEPRIYILVIDNISGRVVGYINLMPVSEESRNKIKLGKIKDPTIFPSDIISGSGYLYLSSIAIHPSYQDSEVFKLLISSLGSVLGKMDDTSLVLANAISEAGVGLCRSFGFQESSECPGMYEGNVGLMKEYITVIKTS